MSFDFHHLPLLVRRKILRQYVPAFTKSSVLSHVPEFRDVLDDPESWLHSFDAFPEKYPRIPFLPPGVYFCEHRWWRGFYVVSVDADTLSFAYYRSTIFSWGSGSMENVWSTQFDVPLSDMREFVSKFDMTPWNGRNINYLKDVDGHVFAVNRIREKLSWEGAVLHSIRKNGKCCARVGPRRWREFAVRRDGTVRARELRSLYPDPVRRPPPRTLAPIPLDSFRPRFGQIYDFRFNFRLRGDCSVSVEFVLDVEEKYPHRFEKYRDNFFFYRIPIFHRAIDTMWAKAVEAIRSKEASEEESEEEDEEESEEEEESEVDESEEDVFKKYKRSIHYVDIELK